MSAIVGGSLAATGRRDPLTFRALAEDGPELRQHLRVLQTEGDQFMERHPPDLSQALVAEAGAILLQLDAACMSGALARDNYNVVDAWLTALNAGQVKPLTEKGLREAMLPALLTACGDLPARCFSRETLTVALRTVPFLGVARIDPVVRPVGEELHSRRAAMKKLLDIDRRRKEREGAEAARLNPAEEEREQVLQRFRAQMAVALDEVSGVANAPVAPRPIPPLPPIPVDMQAKIDRARDRRDQARAAGSPMLAYLDDVLIKLEMQQQAGRGEEHAGRS